MNFTKKIITQSLLAVTLLGGFGKEIKCSDNKTTISKAVCVIISCFMAAAGIHHLIDGDIETPKKKRTLGSILANYTRSIGMIIGGVLIFDSCTNSFLYKTVVQ